MITRALIQESANSRFDPESRSLAAALASRGIPVERFSAKRLLRKQLSLSRDTLVAGSVPIVLQALQHLGIPPPEPDDYPPCLASFLRRRIWENTVGAVADGLLTGTVRPIFVKPKGRAKRFTGRVFSSRDDLGWLEGASRRQPVFCSEVVEWRSEFRTYVLRGRILGTFPYGADPTLLPEEAAIRKAVAALEASGRAPAGYGIDFGVLSSGETALIELNDGFGLGNYGLADDLYADLIVARWCELTA